MPKLQKTKEEVEVMELTSVNNEKVKMWAKLKSKKYRDEENLFFIEGDHLVDIALSKNLVVDLITLEDKYDFDNKYIVTEEIMKKISNQVNISKVAATVKVLTENVSDGNIIILDNLQDPGNLGTIIRSAVAFGFKNIILGEGTVDIYNEKVIRSSEGMIFNINFKKANLFEEIPKIKNDGYIVVGTDVLSGNNIRDFKKEKIAIIIGNEGNGINKNLPVDKFVKISMENSCESLNAGVCASILMYEVYNGK